MENSFAVEIFTRGGSFWAKNGLRFRNRMAAENYGLTLKLRWPLVEDYRIVATVDVPNTTFPVPSDRYAVPRPSLLKHEVVAHPAEDHSASP
jgi:hypothetical protein